MAKKLRPCPFCGSERVRICGRKSYWVECDHCGGMGGHFPTKEGASAFWNRRAILRNLQYEADTNETLVFVDYGKMTTKDIAESVMGLKEVGGGDD